MNPPWPHAMIDIECCGTRSTAALMSIGCAFFDLKTFTVGPTFVKPIHLATSVRLGMKLEPEAVLFWLRQGDAARNAVAYNLMPVDMVLREFREYLDEHGAPGMTRVWGNSARFDMGILDTAYGLLGEEVPWKWTLELCFRTVRNLNPHVVYDPTQRESTHHNALDDALFQINHLFQIKRHNDAHPRAV